MKEVLGDDWLSLEATIYRWVAELQRVCQSTEADHLSRHPMIHTDDDVKFVQDIIQRDWRANIIYTSWNLATLGFSFNAPCLSRCALHPVNAYRAPSRICHVMDWNMWKSVAHSCWPLQQPSPAQPAPAAQRSSRCWLGRGRCSIPGRPSVVYVRILEQNVDFFPMMTPIDKRPSPSVAQHRYASANQISPQCVDCQAV